MLWATRRWVEPVRGNGQEIFFVKKSLECLDYGTAVHAFGESGRSAKLTLAREPAGREK